MKLSELLTEMKGDRSIPDWEVIDEARKLERLLSESYDLLSATEIPTTLAEWTRWKIEALKLAAFITIETEGSLLAPTD